nr:MAG TPA: Protein of unknown function (DUF562) [Caudoviricetes sp.]
MVCHNVEWLKSSILNLISSLLRITKYVYLNIFSVLS